MPVKQIIFKKTGSAIGKFLGVMSLTLLMCSICNLVALIAVQAWSNLFFFGIVCLMPLRG